MQEPEPPGEGRRVTEATRPQDADRVAAGMNAADGYGGRRGHVGGGLGSLRTFESFKNRQFRIFWAAMMGQMGAMNMQMMARSWYIYTLTERPAMLGVMALANALPMLFLSLFGGVMADRVQKKYVLLVGQAASGLVSLGIALSISFGAITPGHLIVAAVLQGTIMGLMMPSRQAIIPEIVGEEGLMNAVSLNAAGMNINRLLAPAAAGFLIEFIGIEGVYYGMTGLYVMATILIFSLPRTGTISLRGGGAWGDLKDGLRYIRSNTTLLALLLLTLVTVLLSMPYMFLLPIFTEDILHVGARGLGVLVSVSGLGAVVGSLVIASLGNRNRGRLLLFSALMLGVGLVGFSISTWYPVSLLFIIPVGLGNAGRMALSNTLIQAYVEDEYRGRVMSIYMMEFGLTSFATFGVSILTEFTGVQWAVGGLAGMLVLVALYYIAFVPTMRRLD